ncbi:hypothetical protein OROHE_008497 [Orobanche hederae]
MGMSKHILSFLKIVHFISAKNANQVMEEIEGQIGGGDCEI